MTLTSYSNNFLSYLRQSWQKSVLYRLTLMSGSTPKHLRVTPTDPWPGDIYKGRQLLDGKFILANQVVLMSDIWMPQEVNSVALRELHEFSWLRDLRALGDNFARRLARQLITNWIDRNQDWQQYSWNIGITGNRVANWIALYDFFCSSADDSFRSLFFREISRQIRHLNYSWEDASTSLERLSALKGIIFATIACSDENDRLDALLLQLEKELSAQILPDGGHNSRVPDIHVNVLRDLIDIRAMLRLIHHEIPPYLQVTINKMAPIVRLFRHGDGGLATFGNYSTVAPAVIDMVLSLADVRGRPPERAASLGYERCVNKSSLILLNIGTRRPNIIIPKPLDAGTGSLNFEWSIGRDRIVLQGDLILQTQDGMNFQVSDLIDSKSLQLHRNNQKGLNYVDVRYERPNGLSFSHRRQLCLGGDRPNLRGEDTIQVPCEAYFGIRFILGKQVEASLSSGSRGVLLQIPNSSKPGKDHERQQWRLLASGVQEIVCEPCGEGQEVLLLGHAKGNEITSVSWAFCQD